MRKETVEKENWMKAWVMEVTGRMKARRRTRRTAGGRWVLKDRRECQRKRERSTRKPTSLTDLGVKYALKPEDAKWHIEDETRRRTA